MKRNWLIILGGAALGAVAGWLYWKYYGCTNGCTITGSPINSSIYGTFMGGLLFNSLFGNNKENPGKPLP